MKSKVVVIASVILLALLIIVQFILLSFAAQNRKADVVVGVKRYIGNECSYKLGCGDSFIATCGSYQKGDTIK
jgi:hypothetical protein